MSNRRDIAVPTNRLGPAARRASSERPDTRGVADRHFTADRLFACLLAGPVALILVCLWPIALACQGRPFLYASERAGRNGVPFRLWKLRTMRVTDGRERVLGGDVEGEVTLIGAWLRWSRIDEFPQIFNVLRGDMRFVGPRPPLMRYFDAYPELYRPVLSEPPGITGLATVLFCHREERLLSHARSATETDGIYRRRCLRQKVRIDTLYLNRPGVGMTLMVLILTVFRGPTAHRFLRRLRRLFRPKHTMRPHVPPSFPRPTHRLRRAAQAPARGECTVPPGVLIEQTDHAKPSRPGLL